MSGSSEPKNLSRSASRVQQALDDAGLELVVVELPDSTRTAKEAAIAIGCEVAQIAKSLVFRGAETGEPVMIVASGADRVDEKKVAALLGEKIERADAAFVREATGYAIGGIPPCGHVRPLKILIDRGTLEQSELWAAAGTPHAVFRLDPKELQTLTGGELVDVRR